MYSGIFREIYLKKFTQVKVLQRQFLRDIARLRRK